MCVSVTHTHTHTHTHAHTRAHTHTHREKGEEREERKHWDSETDGASKEDEALKEIEIDPRMNNVTSKALN